MDGIELDDNNLVGIEKVDTLWAYVAEIPADLTEAGSRIPPSEALIRVTYPVQTGPTTQELTTATLVSALPEELKTMEILAHAYSKGTGLKVRLRRFSLLYDEAELENGRVKSLNRIVMPGAIPQSNH
jgi:hypothetical protein